MPHRKWNVQRKRKLANSPTSRSLVVYGRPEPQGSTRAFMPKRGKFPVVTSDNPKVKPYRQQIALTAMAKGIRPCAREASLSVKLSFYFTRPASAKRRLDPVVKPDLDKLVRSVFDALTGVAFVDDAQITKLETGKDYGDPERTEIEIIERRTPNA